MQPHPPATFDLIRELTPFSYTIEFQSQFDANGTKFDSAGTAFKDKVLAVTTDLADKNVSITYSNNDFTVTISGFYSNVHVSKTHQYYTFGDETLTSTRIEQVPAKIDREIKFTPVADQILSVHYTVEGHQYASNPITITQDVKPNWSIGRDQMEDVIAKGRY